LVMSALSVRKRSSYFRGKPLTVNKITYWQILSSGNQTWLAGKSPRR
jgi:hypothetical protein